MAKGGMDTVAVPLYNTAEDFKNEEEAIGAFCALNDLAAKKLDIADRIDYLLYEWKPIAYCEVKTRNISHDRYSTYQLSQEKLLVGRTLAVRDKIPFILLVKFTDGLYYCDITRGHYLVSTGGRKDRGDPHDIELMAHIPLYKFKKCEVPIND